MLILNLCALTLTLLNLAEQLLEILNPQTPGRLTNS